jgi:hypothetical protein
MKIIGPLHDLLTAEQRRKLPQLVVNVLDPRYLVSIRDGTSLYVGGTLGPQFFSFGPGMAMEMMAVMR